MLVVVGAALPDPLLARGHVSRALAAAFPESMCPLEQGPWIGVLMCTRSWRLADVACARTEGRVPEGWLELRDEASSLPACESVHRCACSTHDASCECLALRDGVAASHLSTLAEAV